MPVFTGSPPMDVGLRAAPSSLIMDICKPSLKEKGCSRKCIQFISRNVLVTQGTNLSPAASRSILTEKVKI
jgi:hypothetical protein